MLPYLRNKLAAGVATKIRQSVPSEHVEGAKEEHSPAELKCAKTLLMQSMLKTQKPSSRLLMS